MNSWGNHSCATWRWRAMRRSASDCSSCRSSRSRASVFGSLGVVTLAESYKNSLVMLRLGHTPAHGGAIRCAPMVATALRTIGMAVAILLACALLAAGSFVLYVRGGVSGVL